MSEYAEFGAA